MTTPLHNNDTISTNENIARVEPLEDVTGIIIEPGHFKRQELFVINESDHTVTFADPETSRVADVRTIGKLTAIELTWDEAMQRWYKEFDPWFFSHQKRGQQ